MKLLNIFKKENKKTTNKFSRFFREASDEEKEKVLLEAARRANERQREVFYKPQNL